MVKKEAEKNTGISLSWDMGSPEVRRQETNPNPKPKSSKEYKNKTYKKNTSKGYKKKQ